MSAKEIEEISKIQIPVYQGIIINNPNIICLDDDFDVDSLNIMPTKETNIKTEIFNLKFSHKIIDCLNDILSVNTGVTIDKITYCEVNGIRKLVIYSDKKLNTKYYENKFRIKKFNEEIPENMLTVPSDINTVLEGIESVLNEKQCCLENACSVIDFLKAYSSYIKNFKTQKESFIEKLKSIISNLYNSSIYSRKEVSDNSIDFDIAEKKFCFEIRNYSNSISSLIADMEFKLLDSNKIVPTKAQDQEGLKIYQQIKHILPNLFEFYIKNEELLTIFRASIPIINSDYILSVNFDTIDSIFQLKKDEVLLKVIHETGYIEKFTYEYNSIELLENILLNDNLYNLYNNTFIKIEDCPKFLQQKLYELKQNQALVPLENNNPGEQKRKRKSIFANFINYENVHW